MSQTNPFISGHWFTRWLQRPGRTRLPYVVDEQNDHGTWIEVGRYATKAEARAGMSHMAANGRDGQALRVAKRPVTSA